MPPLPQFSGSYTGSYTKGDMSGAYAIINLKIYDTNEGGDSVGLFERLDDSATVSHLVFIEPQVTVENTVNQWLSPDAGKYAGIVTGFSTGYIHHITVLSVSTTSPVVDDDTIDTDYTNIRHDFVGGIVGMVGEGIKEDSIHHILYLAPAPFERNGSYEAAYTRFNNPIIGTNQTISANLADNLADVELAKKAIADESCYYLVGQLLRPDDNDSTTPPQNINIDVVTDGLGQPISTNGIYSYLNNSTSEFYINFVEIGGYNFVKDVGDSLNTGIDSDAYPYPYYGNKLPDSGTLPQSNMSFEWPVAKLEEFSAQIVYYEIYGNTEAPNSPEVGVYSLSASTTESMQNTLIDTDTYTNYRILSDGYTIRINRPYTMLESDDIIFSINGVEISNEIGSWLYRYANNPANDDFTERFRTDRDSTDIESLLTIDNADFQNSINTAIYGDTNDVLHVSISNSDKEGLHALYVNPLFAKAMSIFMPTANPQDIVYAIRSPRHIDNIGRFSSSTSHLSSYMQELNINLLNYNKSFPSGSSNKDPSLWSYNSLYSKPAGNLFSNLKYNSGIYIGGAGMESASSVAGTVHPFSGVYNGSNHSIDNLYASASGGAVALFKETSPDATIKSLTLNNFNIKPSGLTIGAVAVAQNAGILEDVTINSSTVSSSYYNYAGSTTVPAGTNRPLEVGGAVAVNMATGKLDNVRVINSTITRTEAGSGDIYAPNRRGAGGLVGDNSGVIINSGVIDAAILVADNVIGGIAGIMQEGGVIQDSYFVSNATDDTSLPIEPIGYDGTAIGIGGNEPFYSIGGIVGYGEGAVMDSLYLALAPSVDVTGDGTADMINPISDSKATGITMQGNVFLSGGYYSSNGIDWKVYNYNESLPAYGTDDRAGLIALGSEFINRSWLSENADNRLANWLQLPTYPYPLAPGAQPTQVPYATSSFLSPAVVEISSEIIDGFRPLIKIAIKNTSDDRTSRGSITINCSENILIDTQSVSLDNGNSFLILGEDYVIEDDPLLDGATIRVFDIEVMPNETKFLSFKLLPSTTQFSGELEILYSKTDFSVVNTKPIVSDTVNDNLLLYDR